MLKTFMSPTSGSPRPDTARTDATRPSPAPATAGRAVDGPVSIAPAPTSPAASEEGSKLIVGPNIKLKGSEITDCEILVVEGRVEAAMNSRDIRIAEGGVFSGRADIDVAEIRGTFEGDLIARKRQVVYATGRVQGTIRYGAMMVEAGGVISGNVGLHTVDAPQTDETARQTSADVNEDIASPALTGPRSLVRGRAV